VCDTPPVAAARSSSLYAADPSTTARQFNHHPRPTRHMSTEPTPTQESQTTAPRTEPAARGRPDPWAATDEDRLPATALAPRQFEPYSTARMRNLMDDDNAYCS
jgi:hypothetical protein